MDKNPDVYLLLSKDRKPLDRFCEVLQEEGLPFTVSDRLIRYMPDLVLPKPEKRETSPKGMKNND